MSLDNKATEGQKNSSNDMHTFLVSQYKFLSTLFKDNMKKLKNLKITLELLNETNQVINSSDSNEEPLQTVQSATNFYNAKLELAQSLPEFLCKSKYFTISARLITEMIQIRTEDKFVVFVSLYTTERVPQMIRHDSYGGKIFIGNTREIMQYIDGEHLVSFKLQIKEVSSNFPCGVFQLKLEMEETSAYPTLIVQPLVIENLKVKAKEYYVNLTK